jgi:hypothetical protein
MIFDSMLFEKNDDGINKEAHDPGIHFLINDTHERLHVLWHHPEEFKRKQHWHHRDKSITESEWTAARHAVSLLVGEECVNHQQR